MQPPPAYPYAADPSVLKHVLAWVPELLAHEVWVHRVRFPARRHRPDHRRAEWSVELSVNLDVSLHSQLKTLLQGLHGCECAKPLCSLREV